jgi:hypothetical protein
MSKKMKNIHNAIDHIGSLLFLYLMGGIIALMGKVIYEIVIWIFIF